MPKGVCIHPVQFRHYNACNTVFADVLQVRTYLLEKYYLNSRAAPAALLKIDINFILQGWNLLTWEDIQMAFKCLHYEIISSLIWHFVRNDGFCKLTPTTGFQLCGNSWRKSGSRTYRIKGHFKIFLGCYDLPMCNREKTIIWFLIPIMIFRSNLPFRLGSLKLQIEF